MISRSAKRSFLGAFFGLLTLVILLAIVNLFFAALERERRAEEERATLRPPETLTHQVTTRDFSEQRFYGARLQPWQEAQIAAEVEGRILEIHTERGASVNEGQPLLNQDDTLTRWQKIALEASLESAKTQKDEFARRLREATELAERRAIPGTEKEAAQAQVDIQEREIRRLEAEIGQLDEMLERHTLKAPFAGIIGERRVDLGDRMAPGQTAFTLVDRNRLRVVFRVSEREYEYFVPETMIEIEVTSRPGKWKEAKILHRAPATEGNKAGFRIEAVLPNHENPLPAGGTARVRAELQTWQNLPFIPAPAVRFEGSQTMVEIRTEDTVELKEVSLGPEIDGVYPVYAGLESGETVLIR
ncbi:MAG: efflux RND transporter periplasmic adaptor subunit [Opitutales bacterium]|nr:efflux RND transporter periplasmic adaptor subunit [Opitutales bacterium]MCH8539618.1 efflux RND transporter periplasmic adaptor subunit [Opitutales bacterium]